MKFLNGTFKNFGSYETLDFTFNDLGLTLISGSTGAGKSTVMDAIAWTLYGQTSKDGAVDEVLKWGSTTPTKGCLDVELATESITIYRSRKGTINDIYFKDLTTNEIFRGKDINETQKLIEARIGVSADLFFTSCYFSQFSKADSFFIAKAKDRREVLDKITDLSLPIKIADRISSKRKEVRKSIDEKESERDTFKGKLSILKQSHRTTVTNVDNWDASQVKRIKDAEEKSRSFEQDKQDKLREVQEKIDSTSDKIIPEKKLQELQQANQQELERLERIQAKHAYLKEDIDSITDKINDIEKSILNFQSGICPTCGREQEGNKDNFYYDQLLIEHHSLKEQLAGLVDKEESFIKRLEALSSLQREKDLYLQDERDNASLIKEVDNLYSKYSLINFSQNVYKELYLQYKNEQNPYVKDLYDLENTITETIGTEYAVKLELQDLVFQVSNLDQLYKLSTDLRGRLLINAVLSLEYETNAYLERHFDSEIKVSFSLDSDKIEVSLQKDGYDCSFRQLSGGQRTMLKLCFGVSLMELSADTAGVKFETLFMDEALNGLDDELKIKAFGLLEYLSTKHSSVLVIDHSEAFKSMFSNHFQVKLEGNSSTISHLT